MVPSFVVQMNITNHESVNLYLRVDYQLRQYGTGPETFVV
jgi:hypothetical protein